VTRGHPIHAPRRSDSTGRDALYIAARAPLPGFTKTRLGRRIGHDHAAALAAAFLRDLARRLAAGPYTVGWYVTPDDAWSDLGPLVAAAALDQRRNVIGQGTGDWTQRQCALFQGASARGEQRTVLIASDSPHLERQVVEDAFARLRDCDLVLGPTEDGGYYLIGMRGRSDEQGPAPWDVLPGVRMSTGTVFDDLLDRARSLGLTTSILSPTFDVDEEADLDRLIPLVLTRDDLAFTRRELDRQGRLGVALVGAGPANAIVGGAR
jgi:rSAM/selenodomain-associated transferase 1